MKLKLLVSKKEVLFTFPFLPSSITSSVCIRHVLIVEHMKDFLRLESEGSREVRGS